ncbi:MAG: amidohydrolase [Desulfofustis sp. PB-SRB1]|nr:amidohydrolase [Desulfofustis sp. PB-SRB1]
MREEVIYNCHVHIFNHENVPDDFLFPYSIPLVRNKYMRWVLRKIIKGINSLPIIPKERQQRYGAFIEAAYRDRQEGNLKNVMGYYPKGTKFVILPMDMALMQRGTVLEDIDEQHAELARLYRDSRYRDVLIPFAHIDPRRPDSLARLKTLVERDGFKGVKIYPALGYPPAHEILMDEIYPYMVENNLPLMSHCSHGPVYTREYTKKVAHAFSDPCNYIKVMESFPRLKICLAHFGGSGEWEKQLDAPRNVDSQTWVAKIVELLKDERYPNLYTDISYTIFTVSENVPYLNTLLQNTKICEKVLFGSDFYMAECESFSEKRLSIYLRTVLGEDVFWTIANENPQKYLFH